MQGSEIQKHILLNTFFKDVAHCERADIIDMFKRQIPVTKPDWGPL